jgi:hypothetical protein
MKKAFYFIVVLILIFIIIDFTTYEQKLNIKEQIEIYDRTNFKEFNGYRIFTRCNYRLTNVYVVEPSNTITGNFYYYVEYNKLTKKSKILAKGQRLKQFPSIDKFDKLLIKYTDLNLKYLSVNHDTILINRSKINMKPELIKIPCNNCDFDSIKSYNYKFYKLGNCWYVKN